MTTIAPNYSDTVRRPVAADTAWMGAALAAAFEPDPIFRWCIPDAAVRGKRLPRIFAAIVECLAPHGETYVDAGRTGVALWVPPGATPLSDAAEQRLGQQLGRLPEADAARFGAISAEMAEQHPHDPHRYLWFVAVHPSGQGQGVGGRLLEDMLARCDAEGEPAYLEATSESNRRLYQRHGFRVTGEITAADSPSMWQMWREPQPR